MSTTAGKDSGILGQSFAVSLLNACACKASCIRAWCVWLCVNCVYVIVHGRVRRTASRYWPEHWCWCLCCQLFQQLSSRCCLTSVKSSVGL